MQFEHPDLVAQMARQRMRQLLQQAGEDRMAARERRGRKMAGGAKRPSREGSPRQGGLRRRLLAWLQGAVARRAL